MARRHAYTWGPPPGPAPRLHAAGWLGRWAFPAAAVVGGLWVVSFVLDHDDRAPGLSVRGWVLLALAGVVLVALVDHRRGGARRLARTVAEYAAVALLVALLMTAGQPVKGKATRAVDVAKGPPAVVRVLPASWRDWLAQWFTEEPAKPKPKPEAKPEAHSPTGGTP